MLYAICILGKYMQDSEIKIECSSWVNLDGRK